MFNIESDHIYIEFLHKCNTTTGKSILDRIILIARELQNIKYVELSDQSSIKFQNSLCNYPLSIFYILLNGKSWYNTFDFESENHASNIAYNEQIRRLPLEKFIELIFEKNREKEIRQLTRERQRIENGQKIYEKISKILEIDDINRIIEYCKNEEGEKY